MNKEYAKKIINKTTADYNKISRDWSIKRWKLPDDILALKKYIKKDDQVLDLGCGNGYFYDVVIDQKASYVGADVAENQLQVCKELHPKANLVLTDPLKLPFADQKFDKVFCLSVIHHIPTEEFQIKFLEEIHRVLEDKGCAFLTAWNLSTQELHHEHQKIDDMGNLLYPFKSPDGSTLIDRFIHVFTVDELSNCATKAGFKIRDTKIVSRGYGKFSNILVVAEK